jgi:5-methylcytosine-specific restriction endonuclease McrA
MFDKKARHTVYMREWRKKLTPEARAAFLAKESARGKVYQKTASGRVAHRASQMRFREKVRTEVLAHYGGKCACCGENEYEFLTLDHIIPVRHRELAKTGQPILSAHRLVLWLRKNDYPEGFQVLCYNCNHAKGLEGECPHRSLAMNTFTLLRLLSGGGHNVSVSDPNGVTA